MTKAVNALKVYEFGVISFLFLITINGLTTNTESRQIIEILRVIFALAATSAVGFAIFLEGVNRIQILGVLIYAFVIFLGLALSFFFGAIDFGLTDIFLNIAIALVGICLIFGIGVGNISIKVAKWFALYTVAGLFMTIILGGVNFTPAPQFVYDYAIESRGEAIVYSQGISKFFGFGAIAFAFLAENNARRTKAILYIIAIAFLLLSALGGARGDFLAILIVVFFYFFIKNRRRPVFLISLVATSAFFVFQSWDYFSENFIIFSRLQGVSDGDYGLRDILLNDALDLLFNADGCIFHGCGLGYFQYYYGLPFGLYPHNILIEFLISFGLPLFLVFSFMVVRGVGLYIASTKNIGFILLLFVAFFFIDLKSGYVPGNWLTGVMFAYFIAFNANQKLQKK